MELVISATSRQLLAALQFLARLPTGEYVGASAVANAIGARANYTGKLLQIAARNGLLRSRKGLGGGFRLALPPEQVRLYDVIEPVEHLGGLTECFLGQSECTDDQPCAVHHLWRDTRDRIVEFLRNTTLAELGAGRSGG